MRSRQQPNTLVHAEAGDEAVGGGGEVNQLQLGVAVPQPDKLRGEPTIKKTGRKHNFVWTVRYGQYLIDK